MSAEWQVLSLADAGVILLDCDHETPEAVESGWPYVGIPQMTTGRVEFSTARRITHADFIAWTRKTKYQKDDVILSRRTNPGVTAIDDTGTEFALGQNLVLLRADGRKVYPPFLRWLVRGPEWWVQIEKFINVGAVFSSLRCRDVPNFELTIPPLPEQRSIAATLGALDDKIELNRKMNTTLEAMARALFRDWFVDFGPTRAKMEGRDPYLSPDLWSLFPERLDDEGKPEGWEAKLLGDFDLELESGRRPKGGIDKGLSGGVPSVGAESIYGVGRFDFSKVKFVSKEFGRSTSSGWVQSHDVAIYKDGANVGDPNRVALFGSGFPFDKFMVNEHVFLLRSKEIGQAFLYFLMQSYQISDRLEKLGSAKAAQPGLNQGEVKSCGFVYPGPAMCKRFNNLVMPWMELALLNGKESQTLAQTRDLLLPRLMSGELQVADLDPTERETAA